MVHAIYPRESQRVFCDGLGWALCFGVSRPWAGRLPAAVGVEMVGEELVVRLLRGRLRGLARRDETSLLIRA